MSSELIHMVGHAVAAQQSHRDGAVAADVHPGSFRDPAGQVHLVGERVYRTVMPVGQADFEFVEASGLLEPLHARGVLIGEQRVPRSVLGEAGEQASLVIEHPRLPYISYPYEWPFSALKAAALLQLDVHLAALRKEVSLSDASAYNVQFVGGRPLFIDRLSLRRYRDGELWLGHRQFCEQFLNPLLLSALTEVPYHAWYRGTLEGIPTDALDRVLPPWRKLSLNMLTHVTLQARLQRGAGREGAAPPKVKPLPKASLEHMLGSMRKWVASLKLRNPQSTTWSDYASHNSYGDESAAAKSAFVADFAAANRPGLLLDLGCNTGEYSKVALDSGAEFVVGYDADAGALEQAFDRASTQQINFLPLYADIANPAPSQGFAERERPGLAQRGPADGLLALALVHHLAIGRNVPLGSLVDWLVRLAPRGVVEFVPKEDAMVRTLLRLREDIFDDYTEQAFAGLLGARAKIVRRQTLSGAGRTLFWYDAS